jgi:hypothetical protein
LRWRDNLLWGWLRTLLLHLLLLPMTMVVEIMKTRQIGDKMGWKLTEVLQLVMLLLAPIV